MALNKYNSLCTRAHTLERHCSLFALPTNNLFYVAPQRRRFGTKLSLPKGTVAPCLSPLHVKMQTVHNVAFHNFSAATVFH
jgi:hypothetical protein